MSKKKLDILIIGAGHAGTEAALIASKLKCTVGIITMDKAATGRMSCNPAIGGLAKGQIVREIDMLGGTMARISDLCSLQIKTLNKKKGRAVWSPRAQVDKREYEKQIKKTLAKSNVEIIIGEAVSVIIKNNNFQGFRLRDGTSIYSRSGVVTAGTFLSGIVHIGERKILAGRMGEERAEGLTESLTSFGFKSARLKTGTPPRLVRKTINWEQTEPSWGDKKPNPLSYFSQNFKSKNIPCHTVHTSAKSHEIIKKNLKKSPMFSGDIGGAGPRYCPSIEDKVYRFKERESHLLHLEPEWENSDQIYLNGFSTSLPESAQLSALQTISGLENVEFFRPGYAIEYDFFPPSQLKASLETKNVSGLFFAGQMNGTSGYEEAAAQGLICGINAVKKSQDKKPLILTRNSSYIGVMIDDLITKSTLEPYRMFTSRAENRLYLRFTNTFERLYNISQKNNLLSEKEIDLIYLAIAEKKTINKNLLKSLNKTDIKKDEKIKHAQPAKELLKRPSLSIFDFPKNILETSTALPRWLKKEIAYDVESDIKYDGYLKRQKKEIEDLHKNEKLLLPPNLNFYEVPGLSKEAAEKLSTIQPENLGQASRISGVKPSDSVVLHIFVSRNLFHVKQ